LLLQILLPWPFLIGATTLFRRAELDLKLAGHFYNPELTKGFDRHRLPWRYIAKYGEFLPHVAAVSAALMWLSRFFWKFSDSYSQPAAGNVNFSGRPSLGMGLSPISKHFYSCSLSRNNRGHLFLFLTNVFNCRTICGHQPLVKNKSCGLLSE
jgi:hypothetical protein